MRQAIILIFVFSSAISMAQEPGYYNGTEGKNGEDLKTALHSIINGHIDFSYSDAKYILNYADEDPDNSSNFILFYTKRSQNKDTYGTGGDKVNREHVWAKSHGNFEDIRPMDGDAYNLHPADASVNITKSNYDFDECSDTGTLIEEAGAYYKSPRFEPSDAAKGEVARTIFYMAVRYEGTNGELDLEAVDGVNTSAKAEHGNLTALLQWNNDFPPTDLERRRNERVHQAQGNRNPFIDNPEFANLIWSGTSVPGISIGSIEMADQYPIAGSSTQLSASITGNTEAALYYGAEWDSETHSVSLSNSNGTWSGDFNLSSFSAGDMVNYKIVAGDGSTNEAIRGTYTIPTNLTLTDISAVQGTGSASPMTNSIVSIGGIVTANFDNTYYLQNGSGIRGGIAVYDIRRGRIGDSIVVTGKVAEYNGLTELTNVSYSYVYEKNTPVHPPVITIAEVGEDYEGMLVTIRGVTFLEGDTEIPLEQSADLHFTDGSNTMLVYSRYNSRLGGEIVPSGTVNVTGVISAYNSFQMLINSIDDIEVGEDNDAPLLSGVVVNDAYWIEVSFNEKLDKTSAELIANYTISDGVTITGAYLYNDTKVLLLVEGLLDQDYTLTVFNISDLQGNIISEDTYDFHSDYTSVGTTNLKMEEMELFPNPASEVLNIEFPEEVGPASVQIFDLQGRLINTYQIEGFSSQISIDVSYMKSGVYIAKLNTRDIVIQDIFSISK
jgi:endonuclease I